MNLKRCSHFKTRRNSFYLNPSIQFSSVAQSCLTLCDPWTAARQASLSITNSGSLLKLMSIESVTPSSHLILCCPVLLLPSIFPSRKMSTRPSTLPSFCKLLLFKILTGTGLRWGLCWDLDGTFLAHPLLYTKNAFLH